MLGQPQALVAGAYTGPHGQKQGDQRQVVKGRLGGAAKAAEAIADAMGAKGHRISQEGVRAP
jgi:hypothetical protein